MNQKVKQEFAKRYGTPARVYCSPGRINLIGEHTDYNLGFVLPGAIDKAIFVAIAPSGSDTSNFYSVDYDSQIAVDLDGAAPEPQWARYIYGVVQEMRGRGATIANFDCVFGGNVPLGAGLSSSAALESAFAFALNDLYGAGLGRDELAKIGQMTEHNYIGVRCGIMDQFASLFGQAGTVVKLDCRTLAYDRVPFKPEGCSIVLIDSMVKHSLASSEYNVRRQQCEEGVSVISRHEEGIGSLRDVTHQMLEKYKESIDPVSYRRCKFVLDENQRVEEACIALKEGDYVRFGEKMNGSHRGLSKDYQVSCEELDFIADIAHQLDGVLGARMMGGGFGGCVIALVKNESRDYYVDTVTEKYQAHYGKTPRVIEVAISDGARRLE